MTFFFLDFLAFFGLPFGSLAFFGLPFGSLALRFFLEFV
jgi:hypothetical protein